MATGNQHIYLLAVPFVINIVINNNLNIKIYNNQTKIRSNTDGNNEMFGQYIARDEYPKLC